MRRCGAKRERTTVSEMPGAAIIDINMKIAFLILSILFTGPEVTGQMISSAVEIATIYSQNEKFYVKSIPFDNEAPSLRGKTYVYEKGNAAPLYIVERGFALVGDVNDKLILSNNGEVIFYAISWGANEAQEGLKSVNVYKKGKLIKSFTKTDITGCDENKERCDLIYSNYDEVVDKEKSGFGTSNYRKVFKDGVDEKERFLSDFPIFSSDDTVYLVDSKKKVHIFDLKEGSLIRSDSFDGIFEQISNKGRHGKTELQTFRSPTFLKFPKLKNGKTAHESLANYIGMKAIAPNNINDEQYKQYSFSIEGYISRDGSFEIENIEVDAELPRAKIIEFFKANKFDSSSVPAVFEKWHIGDEYFYFRKRDDRVAREEKRQEQIKQREEFEKRLTSESIKGVYIPKDLGECFIELDKLLKEVDKKEMQSLSKRGDMIRYHHGLGTWIRNNWGLWGGSRLQKYFTDKGIMHPDDMSSVVLSHYHDWLNGKKEIWKDWEKNQIRR
jgi:hypothetical protein